MDRLITHILSLSPLNALAIRLLGHYVTIYMLHRPATPQKIYNGTCSILLERCLAYAQKKQFQFASIDELVQMALRGEKPNKPTLCFTMDDGYLDQLTVLTPILLKYHAKPTVFVLSDFSDNIDWPWDAKLVYLAHQTPLTSIDFVFEQDHFSLRFDSLENRIANRRYLTTYAKYLPDEKQDQFLKVLQNAMAVTLPKAAPAEFAPADWSSLRHFHQLGLNVGAHGKTHKVLSSLSSEKVQQELITSRHRLFTEIPEASNVFCYSSGTDKDYSASHCPLVKDAGFIGAVSAKPGNTTLDAIQQDLFNIKRHSFPSSYDKFIRYSSWIECLRTRIN